MDIKRIKRRLAQWADLNHQKHFKGISRPISPEEAIRWAGTVLEFVNKYCGGFPAKTDKIEGIRIMHERLALVRPRQE